jgi:hypothetical protein
MAAPPRWLPVEGAAGVGRLAGDDQMVLPLPFARSGEGPSASAGS